MTERTLDLHGAICPDPLLQVQSTMRTLAKGDRLVVLLDYPLSVDTISRWAQGNGHEVVELGKTGASGWRLVLVRC